jgi:mannose-1-phosphate guanylyltransferase
MSVSSERWSTHWDAGHNWALVLAAGQGSRLQALTTTASGIAVPKQFCSLGGGSSLLHAAIDRARVVAPPERTCVVVAEQHRPWWQSLPQSIPESNVVAQPFNRGTANGILLPLLHILHCDPDASILVLPSDHYVRNETVLAGSLRKAMSHLGPEHESIVLLGIQPEQVDSELGYIVPVGGGGPDVRDVSEFVEKPSAAAARKLIDRGGVWNSFIFAARGVTLLRAFEEHSPALVGEMRRIVAAPLERSSKQRALHALYENLPAVDFSRDIIQARPDRLQVLTVPPCGWTDLGTPDRVAVVVDRLRPTPAQDEPLHTRGFLDLAARQAQMSAA